MAEAPFHPLKPVEDDNGRGDTDRGRGQCQTLLGVFLARGEMIDALQSTVKASAGECSHSRIDPRLTDVPLRGQIQCTRRHDSQR